MANEDMHLRNTISKAARDAANVLINDRRFERMGEASRLRECLVEFASLDNRALHRKTDKELAEFHADFPPGSPQYALASNEWNRRLVTRQIKSSHFGALIGFIGMIIGVFLGWYLASYPPNHADNNKEQSSQQSNADHQRDKPDAVPPNTIAQPIEK